MSSKPCKSASTSGPDPIDSWQSYAPLFKTLCIETYPPKLKDQILAAFSGSFDRTVGNNLRTIFEQQGKEAMDRWAALVNLACRTGLASLNGTQVKSFARTPWDETGLVEYPVGLHVTCPNCSKHASATVALPKMRSYDGSPNWRVQCTHCGYEECKSDGPEYGLFEEISGEEKIREWVCKSPAVTGQRPASKKRRDSALRILKGYWKNLDNMLAQEIQASAEETLNKKAKNHSVGGWISFMHHTHLYENLMLGIPLMFQVEHGRNYTMRTTEADRLLQQVSLSDVSINSVRPDHPAPHWRTEFDAHRAKVEDALAAGDAVEGAIQSALFIESCHEMGLATSIVLNVKLPAELRPAPAVPPRVESSDRLHDVSIAELSAYLAKILSTQLVTVDTEALARQLHRYSATTKKSLKN